MNETLNEQVETREISIPYWLIIVAVVITAVALAAYILFIPLPAGLNATDMNIKNLTNATVLTNLTENASKPYYVVEPTTSIGNATEITDTSKKANVTGDGCIDMYLERRFGGSETHNYYNTACDSTFEVLSASTPFDAPTEYNNKTLTFTTFEDHCVLQNQDRFYSVNVRICEEAV